MNRRDFIKIVGAGTATVALSSLTSCVDNQAGDLIIPTDKMTYRTDPRNGNRLSLLGFGMMRLPRIARSRGESLPDVNDLDQEAINNLVDFAIEHGINVFDTAPMYCKGFSEKATGAALSRHPREKYFISTKLSNSRPPSGWSKDESLRMYYNSFEDLQVDYIDYYFLHNVGNMAAFNRRFIENGMLDFLIKEKQDGRIKSLGWSFHGDGSFLEYMSSLYDWDFTMINLNYLNWSRGTWRAGGGVTDIPSEQMYEILASKNIPIWIMGPLMGGGLSAVHYKARELMMQANPTASTASWGFRFAASSNNVVTVLSGMTFMDHLRDNVRTFSPLVPLSQTERQILLDDVNHIAMDFRNINCTKCQYCMPCPYGLDIPELFMHYNKCMNEGNYPIDKQSEDYKRARRAFLIGMDRAVSPMRQADKCIGCRLCLPCPQFINIPGELRRIASFADSLRMEV